MNIKEYETLTGKSYMTESCSVTNVLDKTSLGIINEIGRDKDSRLILKGVLGTVLDERNVNGRIYTTEAMKNAIKHCQECNMFENRRLLCSADDHPVTDFVPPSRASHIVTNAYIENVNGKNYLLCDVLVLNTQNGKDLRELVEANASIGTSIRGFGNLNPMTDEVEDYEFVGFDFVGDPSAGTFSRNVPHQITVESVKYDSRIKILESNEVDSGDSVDTSLANTSSDTDSSENSYNAYDNPGDNKMGDYEMELIKLEQRNKGKSYTESTLQELITLKNKLVIESKLDTKEIESNEIYSRMYNECVKSIEKRGVAQIESQLNTSKDLADKSKEMLRRVTTESVKKIEEATKMAKEAAIARRNAMKALAKLQKESVSIEEADRHMMEQCKKVANAANKEMRKAANHCKVLESRLKARNLVMKILSSK